MRSCRNLPEAVNLYQVSLQVMALPAKKHFGQHFLRDLAAAKKIAGMLEPFEEQFEKVLEIGPGRGVLTNDLYERYKERLVLVEIDNDLIPDLKVNYPDCGGIIHADFLDVNLREHFEKPFAVIGNFPYNISSQILFKVVESRELIPVLVGMFQKEVAQRVSSVHGNKVYGLLTVWVQAFYDVEYMFTLTEGAFNPPPKVKSAVIRLKRKETQLSKQTATSLLKILKATFGQRRKTLRNGLSSFPDLISRLDNELLKLRPEQLPISEFVRIAQLRDT